MQQDAVGEIGSRFKKFLDDEWRGNQSDLAKKLTVSQPAVSRVAVGEQLPSGKLLLALREYTNINLDWLLIGRGEMLLGEEDTAKESRESRVPVSDQPLPGSPVDYPAPLSGDLLPGYGTVRPTQYWLRVQKNDPITRSASQKIQAGDLLLLETNRSLFPDPHQVYSELWVVRRKERKDIKYRLAEVSHSEAEWYEVSFFEQVPASSHGVKQNDLIARKIAIVRR